MPLNYTDIKILNFLYEQRTQDIYHPPHIDRLVELTRLSLNRVELIVKFLNIKDYVYTYHAPGPVKITTSGIDVIERNFDNDKLQKISKGRSDVLDELKSIHEGSADKWVSNDHLSQAVGIDDRLYLYSMADYLAQKKLVELRRRALGFFHIRLSEYGYLSARSPDETVCS